MGAKIFLDGKEYDEDAVAGVTSSYVANTYTISGACVTSSQVAGVYATSSYTTKYAVSADVKAVYTTSSFVYTNYVWGNDTSPENNLDDNSHTSMKFVPLSVSGAPATFGTSGGSILVHEGGGMIINSGEDIQNICQIVTNRKEIWSRTGFLDAVGPVGWGDWRPLAYSVSGDVASVYTTSSFVADTYSESGECVTSSQVADVYATSSYTTKYAVSSDVAGVYATSSYTTKYSVSSDVAAVYATSSYTTKYAVSSDVAGVYTTSSYTTKYAVSSDVRSKYLRVDTIENLSGTTNIYVWGEATGSGDGTTFSNAYTTIQAAVEALPDIITSTYRINIKQISGNNSYVGPVFLDKEVTVGSLTFIGDSYIYGESCTSNNVAGKICADMGTTITPIDSDVWAIEVSNSVIVNHFLASCTSAASGVIYTTEDTFVPKPGWFAYSSPVSITQGVVDYPALEVNTRVSVTGLSFIASDDVGQYSIGTNVNTELTLTSVRGYADGLCIAGPAKQISTWGCIFQDVGNDGYQCINLTGPTYISLTNTVIEGLGGLTDIGIFLHDVQGKIVTSRITGFAEAVRGLYGSSIYFHTAGRIDDCALGLVSYQGSMFTGLAGLVNTATRKYYSDSFRTETLWAARWDLYAYTDYSPCSDPYGITFSQHRYNVMDFSQDAIEYGAWEWGAPLDLISISNEVNVSLMWTTTVNAAPGSDGVLWAVSARNFYDGTSLEPASGGFCYVADNTGTSAYVLHVADSIPVYISGESSLRGNDILNGHIIRYGTSPEYDTLSADAKLIAMQVKYRYLPGKDTP